jgi:hypothetical protein
MLDFVKTNIRKIERSELVRTTLNDLCEQYKTFEQQKRTAENTLYVLLENCLDFYYMLQTSDAHAVAFKNMCHFKFNSASELTLLIAKAVFGDTNKQHYAYARALQKAVELGIGQTDDSSMAEWLRSNGGVNAAIRIDQRKKADELLEFGQLTCPPVVPRS